MDAHIEQSLPANRRTLKLRRPLMANGAEVKELPYDFEDMTALQKLSVTHEMENAGFATSGPEEIDPCYHLFLFAKAVDIATGGEISTPDVLRLSAKDSQTGAQLARNFFYL